MCNSLHSPKSVARLFVRIGFGLALAFVGIAHYQNLDFANQVGDGLGVLSPLGMIWGYILPGLMIVGGLLLAFGIYMNVAAYLSTIALISIPAGLMLKSVLSGMPLDQTMPMAMNAFIWILVLMIAVKGGAHGCGTSGACCCGPTCDCPTESKPSMTPVKVAPVKSSPVAPVAVKASTAPAKKPAPKKAAAKKPSAKIGM